MSRFPHSLPISSPCRHLGVKASSLNTGGVNWATVGWGGECRRRLPSRDECVLRLRNYFASLSRRGEWGERERTAFLPSFRIIAYLVTQCPPDGGFHAMHSMILQRIYACTSGGEHQKARERDFGFWPKQIQRYAKAYFIYFSLLGR